MVQIGLIGVGLVGRELLQQLKRVAGLNVVGVMNSKRMVTTDKKALESIEIEALSTHAAPSAPLNLTEFINNLLNNCNDSIKVVVDCTSSEDIVKNYPQWLSLGLNIVTPNKKGLSGSSDLYNEIKEACLKYNRFCFHESTVGAGLPIIETLNNLVSTGDKIIKIEGILSGTLSYIFNNFSKTSSSGEVKKFSDIVSVAKEKGFTEPDPRDDLNGMDVARKVVILGRVAGLNISLETLEIENCVPKKLQEVNSTSDFMAQLPNYDDYFSKLNEDAKAEGKVLRCVGVVDPNGTSAVKLIKYSLDHPFASLTGSDNIVAFTTERFPSPLIIQGAGAGSSVTVYGILSDLLKIKAQTQYSS